MRSWGWAVTSKPAKSYTQEEITRGLMAMVAWAGKAVDASKSLKEQGLDVPTSTLRTWIQTTHSDEYQELRSKYAHKLEEALVRDMREVAIRATRAQQKAVEEAEKRLERGADTDPARTAAALSKVSQTSTDKLLALTGRPTAITETRGLNEILRSLAQKVPGLVVFEGEVNEDDR